MQQLEQVAATRQEFEGIPPLIGADVLVVEQGVEIVGAEALIINKDFIQPKLNVPIDLLPQKTYKVFTTVIESGMQKIVETNFSTSEALEILNNSEELSILNNEVNLLMCCTPNIKFQPSNERYLEVNKYLKAMDTAEKFYEKMRIANDDVFAICRSTGINRHIIQKIKNHVFVEEHIQFGISMEKHVDRFSSDIDIAEAWGRLIDGNFVQSDLILLQHEYAEFLIMQGTKIDYNIAHYELINKIYDWNNEL